MNWKNILKMPVPIDTEETRDKDHTQAITEYEKTVIEPALKALMQGQQAGQYNTIIIDETDAREDKSFPVSGGIGYFIGFDSVASLGKNISFIILGKVNN